MTTINISLPTSLYADIKKLMASRGYASISEFMRYAARKIVYPTLTENGFTPEFEEAVLRSDASPRDKDLVWNTPEEIDAYFANLKKELQKNGKNRKKQ